MSIDVESIQKLTPTEKVELYYLLGNDKELNEYLYQDARLFDELARRDREVAEGNMPLLTRQELTQKLQQRKDAL